MSPYNDKSYKMVAKLKFWFGIERTDLFNSEKYVVELRDPYIYLYIKRDDLNAQ